MTFRLDKQPQILTICGSMRFFETMLDEARRLSLEGCIVLMPFVNFKQPQDYLPYGESAQSHKANLDALHFDKIKMSDGIYVVDVGVVTGVPSYVGESTKNEIAFARSLGKSVVYRSHKATQRKK